MFSKKQKRPEPQQDAPAKVGDVIEVKYSKPKILVLDLEDEASEQLLDAGWNVTRGTFGRPYKVGKSSGFSPVIVKFLAPNYTEQEIVIVDLATGEPADGPEGDKHVPKEELDWWAKCDSGIIDPRPRSMLFLQKFFNRTLENGGVFVLFADDKARQELTFARDGYRGLYDNRDLEADLYSFIKDLDNLNVVSDHGTEMFPAHEDPVLGALVAEHIKDARFFCVLQPRWNWAKNTFVLAKNKFDAAVGVAHYHQNGAAVIVLPQIARKSEFILRLVQECLPAIAPHLFPHIQKGLWTHRAEYELPRVMQLKAEQVAAEQRARAEVAELEKKLQAERTANGWLHDLITGTDTELVEAVRKALGVLGFSKVVDVDEERDKEGKSRREDLQIQDQSPTLIVDVKGVGGFPSDDEALQAEKHAAIRMRELKRTDIVGLSIVNHQRHLPPLDRENTLPFRQELIDAALERTLGLMTAWDLYRIVRNFKKLGWRSEDVKPVFYQTGRIEAVPQHYEFLGKIAKAWTDKFGVIIEQGELQLGDRVGVEFSIEFEEVAVESIQVKDQKVEKAKLGDPEGILWPAGNLKLREGMRVFRIQKN